MVMLSFVFLSTLINTQSFAFTTDLNSQVSVIQEWDSYKKEFNKTYASAVRELERLRIFIDNIEAINQHNELFDKKQATYKKEINEFSDLTSEEFINIYLSRPYYSLLQANIIEENDNSPPSNNNNSIPDEIDWVTKGVVAGVRHQGYLSCASSIVAAELIEGYIFKEKKHLVNISAQVFVDCLTKHGNCEGLVDEAIDYSIKNGIVTEKSYPFKEMPNECMREKVAKFEEVAIKNCTVVTGNETMLKEIVATVGPVACYMRAAGLKDYKSGIYDDTECGQDDPQMNHALLIVGYGNDKDTKKDYWLVKNSWGSRWGENGYARVARNSNNLCGIANQNTYIPT